MAPLRNANIPESMPKLRELRDFMVANPPPATTGPEQREMTQNEFYVRGSDAIVEVLQKLRDKLGEWTQDQHPPNDETAR